MKTLTGMGGSGGARELAEMLRQLGRGRDTVLAHITPEEAQMLMDMGGSGTTNPATGLPEFQDDFGAEFDPYMGMDVSQGGREITPEESAYYFAQQGGMAPVDITASQNIPTVDVTGGQAQPAGEMDIGFGPGQFTPEYTSADVAGMRPDQFQRMMSGTEPGFLQTAAQGIEDTAAQYRQLAREYPTVAKMLSTGATTLPALIQAMRARRAGERSAAQFRELGAPLRAQGEALRTQALAGQLTPQQAAQQEAARARLRQTAAGRGATTGTQAAMIENQLARTRAQLSETNLNNALKQLNLANAYDEAAIKAKIASDQEIEASLANIFANLGRDITSQAPAQQPRQTAGLASQPEVTRRPDVRG